ncbi:MAG: FAD-dependent oxidoreductase [Gammaproteobacteria bacterium]|nr:FAD-dependent oxidoreductase [Gammaproteobacteria bacterium]OUV68640.1 MAG: hypothetical protein CBC93_01030 [Gammaproteobacteria bacterium TMED133]
MIKTDIAIVGGGITGLWLHSLLKARGYQALLFEKSRLGSGQTLASQGMIHGGLKYNLDGVTGSASETISSMPDIWRACLSGESDVDLSDVGCVAWQYHIFSDGRFGNKLSAFLGSRALRGGPRMLSRRELPPPFNNDEFKGVVYEIPDLVLDTPSLIQTLAKTDRNDLIEAKASPIPQEGPGINSLILEDGTKIKAKYFIFAAGIGNEELIAESNISVATQRRGLHQVLVKGTLPFLNGHAVSLRSKDKPRFTVTSYRMNSKTTWYLGGDLAETGVERGSKDQIDFTKQELNQFLPSIDIETCEITTLRIERAEPRDRNKLRPDRPSCVRDGNVIVCWPIKLTLVPLLAEKVLAQITLSSPNSGASDTSMLKKAQVGAYPWDNLL